MKHFKSFKTNFVKKITGDKLLQVLIMVARAVVQRGNISEVLEQPT